MSAPPAPIDTARHRRRNPWWRSLGRILLGAALILGALSVSALVPTEEPDLNVRFRPFPVREAAGGVSRVDGLEYRVVGVEPAAEIVPLNSDFFLDTRAMWLLVWIRAMALTEPMTLGYAELVDGRGRTYSASSRFSQPMMYENLQPSIPVIGAIAFEVPRDALPDLRLRITKSSPAGRDMQPVAEVDLGLTAAQTVDWGTGRNRLNVPDPVVDQR